MQNKVFKNILIMIIPIIPFAIYFLRLLGESFFLFLFPLMACLCMTITLTTRLSTKDAITYPFVQYPFLILLLFLFWIQSPGLGFILILPMTLIINMGLGYVYFRYAKRKKWFTKILLLLTTFVVTIYIYPSVFALSPRIEYGEFPFRIVYKIDGVTHEIEDVIEARFTGIQMGSRRWTSNVRNGTNMRISIFRDSDVPSIFTRGRINESIEISFWVGTAGYYMGDRRSNYSPGPKINYRETYRMSTGGTGTNTVSRTITKQQLADHFGIEILEWNFSEPIRNQFRFTTQGLQRNR